MPTTVQRQTAQTAFRAETPYGSATARSTATTPRQGATIPAPESRPAPVPAVRRRSRVQTAWLLMMLVAALLVVSCGLVYLSGYARVTAEGYRRAKLMTALRQEREKAQQWRQMRAIILTPTSIGQRAKANGLIRLDEKQTVTVQ